MEIEKVILKTTDGITEVICSTDKLNYIRYFLPDEVSANISAILKNCK